MKIICDMDGTICDSRQKISKEVKDYLSNLDVIVISGASREQMEYQLDGLKCTILAQSGNDTPLWKNLLSADEIQEIYSHIYKLNWVISPDMIENRGCQISPSLTGHNAPIFLKKNFDADQKIRKALLEKTPFNSETITCKVAGTTCLDYTIKEGTKGKNIERWIKENNFNKEECIYFGDALFKGGNDETVIGVITTVEVSNPTDFINKLRNYV